MSFKKDVWLYNIETQAFTKNNTFDYSHTRLEIHSIKAPGVPIVIQDRYHHELEFLFYQETSNQNKYAYKGGDGVGNLENNRNMKIEMSTGDFSGLGAARVYYSFASNVTGTKKVFYTQIHQTTKAVTTGKWTDANVLSINSKVAVHPTDDIVSFSGTNTNSYLGKVYFTDRELANLFSLDIDTYFDYGLFVPGQNTLVVYFHGGKFCIINYDLALSTGSMSNCKHAIGTFL